MPTKVHLSEYQRSYLEIVPTAVTSEMQRMLIHCVRRWNKLPDDVVNAPSVPSFENRLDKHWACQEFLYDFKAPLLSQSSWTLDFDLALVRVECASLGVRVVAVIQLTDVQQWA